MLWPMSEFPFFLRLNNISLCVGTAFRLSVRLSMDVHVAPTPWPLWIALLCTWVCKCLFKSSLSVPLHTHREVAFLGNVVVLFLTVKGPHAVSPFSLSSPEDMFYSLILEREEGRKKERERGGERMRGRETSISCTPVRPSQGSKPQPRHAPRPRTRCLRTVFHSSHHFTIQLTVHMGSRCFTPLVTLASFVSFCSLTVAIPVDVRWYFTVILICFSVMIMDVEDLFIFLLAICKSSSE